MKKYILLFILLFTLTGCDLIKTTDIDCDTGYKLVDAQCEKESPIVDPIVNPTDGETTTLETICPELDNIGEWQSVWCDEFDYTGLPDSDLWGYDVGGSGWGNNELQYYTQNDLDNAHVEDGHLTITAIKEDYMSNDYTSARLVTKDKGDWLYGKIQIKAKLPSGVGTWPAIWMLPTDWEYGGWPASGEIDIMEHVGYDVNTVYSTIHTGAYNHMLGTQIGFEYESTTLETSFHVYEIEWEPGLIKSFIDGIHYATFFYNPSVSEGILPTDAWPFDQQFHLILNIAVGGNWGGSQGVHTDIWPQEMVVDYVRVYQKDYASGDIANPSVVTGITASTTANQAFVSWDESIDDNAVKEYEVYVDDVLTHTQFHNAYILTGLVPATTYKIGVIAVDFAGNKSVVSEYNLTTGEPDSIINIIQAEDYSTMQGIDTQDTSDAGGGENVGWADSGDYLEYVLVVPESGDYTVDFRVASEVSGGAFTLTDGNNHTVSLTTPNTGGWQSWQTITSENITLEAGTHTFRITFTADGTNLNYFEFKKVD